MLRNLGRFSITREDIEETPDLIKKIMGECIILRAEAMYHGDSFDYVAYSLFFETVPSGCIIPEYKIIFSRLKDGHIKWMFWPVED